MHHAGDSINVACCVPDVELVDSRPCPAYADGPAAPVFGAVCVLYVDVVAEGCDCESLVDGYDSYHAQKNGHVGLSCL